MAAQHDRYTFLAYDGEPAVEYYAELPLLYHNFYEHLLLLLQLFCYQYEQPYAYLFALQPLWGLGAVRSVRLTIRLDEC